MDRGPSPRRSDPQPPGNEPSGAQPAAQEAQAALLDRIAWQILTDLLRPDAGLGVLPPAGFEQLIGLRLMREAREAQVPPESLAEAFGRAWAELSGRNRPPRNPDAGQLKSDRDPDPDDEPVARIEDL